MTSEDFGLIEEQQHTSGPYGTISPKQDDQESEVPPKSKKQTDQTGDSHPEHDSTRNKTMSKFYIIL